MKVALTLFGLVMFAAPAFADYEYRVNKNGTGYFRDSSNDGNPYNNANYLGLND